MNNSMNTLREEIIAQLNSFEPNPDQDAIDETNERDVREIERLFTQVSDRGLKWTKIDKVDINHNGVEAVERSWLDIFSFDQYTRTPPMRRPWDGIYRVYALVHPDTGFPFYIGHTKDMNRRFAQHCQKSSNKGVRHIVKWLVLDMKLPIIMKLYETRDKQDALREEERLVKKYSKRCLLMNVEYLYDHLLLTRA